MCTPRQITRFFQAAMVLITIFGTACEQIAEPLALRCDITLSDISPEEASPGNTVIASGTPMTTVWDTAIYVGAERASILRLDREQCTLCDECRSANRCTSCSACKECAETCRNTCTETVSFVVPVLSGGDHDVSVYNRHGQSNSISLSILPSPDTGLLDSGLSDTSTPSTDSSDTAGTSTSDTSVVDSGETTTEDTASP